MESKLFGWGTLPELSQAAGNAQRAAAMRRRQAIQMGPNLAELVAEDYSTSGRSDVESNARGGEVLRVISRIGEKFEEAEKLLKHLKEQIDAPMNAADEARAARRSATGGSHGPRLNV